jgi:alkanesulfonate monooxygenase SsuD/methylene tetrahydromethanopterin reductase-like flavin-dependent oxidoreductase (luciferase family)
MGPGGIPTWVGVGGSPQSVIRAARYGLPLMIAIIGGQPEAFAGQVDLYFRALEQFGQPRLPVGQHSIGMVADTDEEAADRFFAAYQPFMRSISKERGFAVPSRAQFDTELQRGALFVGSPETVAQKIARVAGSLQLSRFDLKYDLLDLPADARMTTIELLGTVVAPRVRELLAEEPAHV